MREASASTSKQGAEQLRYLAFWGDIRRLEGMATFAIPPALGRGPNPHFLEKKGFWGPKTPWKWGFGPLSEAGESQGDLGIRISIGLAYQHQSSKQPFSGLRLAVVRLVDIPCSHKAPPN